MELFYCLAEVLLWLLLHNRHSISLSVIISVTLVSNNCLFIAFCSFERQIMDKAVKDL